MHASYRHELGVVTHKVCSNKCFIRDCVVCSITLVYYMGPASHMCTATTRFGYEQYILDSRCAGHEHGLLHRVCDEHPVAQLDLCLVAQAPCGPGSKHPVLSGAPGPMWLGGTVSQKDSKHKSVRKSIPDGQLEPPHAVRIRPSRPMQGI